MSAKQKEGKTSRSVQSIGRTDKIRDPLEKPTVLFVGAHYDDVELGCGGLISRHRDVWDCKVWVISKKIISGNANQDAARILGYTEIRESWMKRNPSWFGQYGEDSHTKHVQYIRNMIFRGEANLKNRIDPDIVFTVEPDHHPDHKALFEAVETVFRHRTLILYRPHRRDLGIPAPNMWRSLSIEDVDAKCKALEGYRNAYKPVMGDRSYLHDETIRAIARVDGQVSDTEYAEAFRIYRLINFLKF